MSRFSVAVAAMLAGLVLACSHAGPASPERAVSAGPIGEPRPFAALYRLDCCRQSNLLATVRGDGESLSVAVAAGPAGTVVEAWLGVDGGWLRNGGERCVRMLPPGMLPLAGGAAVPLDPWLGALLLGGIVPLDARPSPRGAGWVEASAHGVTASWLVSGEIVTKVETARDGESGPALAVTLAEHHGHIPGRLVFRAGSESGELVLVEWRSAAAPLRPAWVTAPPCRER